MVLFSPVCRNGIASERHFIATLIRNQKKSRNPHRRRIRAIRIDEYAGGLSRRRLVAIPCVLPLSLRLVQNREETLTKRRVYSGLENHGPANPSVPPLMSKTFVQHDDRP